MSATAPALRRSVAIIAGVGPGTGSAIARRFASEQYTVALLARKPASYDPLVAELDAKYGKGTAVGISTDISNADSVRDMLASLQRMFNFTAADSGSEKPNAVLRAAVYNASGGFVRKPFLETSAADMLPGWNVTVMGAFYFSQAILPLLLDTAANATAAKAGERKPNPPTIIFTGATASLKGSANFAAFASAKFALRGLTQSLAREFGPRGVHVAHVVVDGIIDTPSTKAWTQDGIALNVDEMAQTYWDLHRQGSSAWSAEVDVRPAGEKW